MHRRNFVLFLLWSLTCCCSLSHAFESSDLKTADKYYVEKSYQLAQVEFEKFLNEKSNEALTREVTFKWADSVVKGKDEAHQEEAIKKLQELIEGKEHDRWWAEANVTVASLYIERDPYGKMADIKNFLDNARDYWAGSSDIDLARERFLRISFMLADFITSRWGWYNSDIRLIRLHERKTVPQQPSGNQSLQILFEEILKIAKSDEDKAKAYYSLGMAYMQDYSGDAKLKNKAVEYFENVTKNFSKTEWVDDAFYQLGNYYEAQGNFLKAVETYHQYLKQFKVGESAWVDDAKRRLDDLVNPSIRVNVASTFVPDSEIQFNLAWRNIKEANLTLYKMDLTKELQLNVPDQGNPVGYSNYQELLKYLVETSKRYTSLPIQFSWSVKLKDEAKHIAYSENKGLAEWRKDEDTKDIDLKKGILPPGAYLLVATAAGGVVSYDLVLVSDMAIVSKITKDTALFFTIDAKTGKPIAGGNIKYLYTYYDPQGSTTRWDQGEGITDQQGILKVSLKNFSAQKYYRQHALLAMAHANGSQAFVQNNYYDHDRHNKGDWWLYAFSDRPAYRPNETISFKGILRRYDGATFSTAPGMVIKARIYDAQNTQVMEQEYTLNDYGAFDGNLQLDDKALLGEYTIQLYSTDTNTHLSTAKLFRLEEYKLPEFTVTIRPQAKEDTKTSTGYRLGDTVTIEVDAQYYFGGPVANAQVEYLVYQKEYYHSYSSPKNYAWYYEDVYPRHYGNYGYGSLMKQEKIQTDTQGKARFTIETSKDTAYDMQYHVEVRVVDQSRREIRATSDIKVTQKAFFAYLEPKQNLYRPGDKVQVLIKTMTANDEPVSIDGKVSVLRNWWREPVIEADKMTMPGRYDGQEIVTKFIKTNERGEATFEFEPNDDGYYVVELTGFDNGGEVKSQTHVFVCRASSQQIGYQYGGLQIIMEKDTYQVGETARAMIVTDRPGTWVYLTAEADDIYSYQMLHLEGSVKLIEIPVTEQFTPNVFLNVLSADHYQLKMNALQIIVPPVDKFLNVTIRSDKAVYSPQEQGVFDLEVTDKDGKPVSAQVALGITDASVYYIQQEYAPDIRQYFFGDKRMIAVQTQASFYQRPYLRLLRNDQNELIRDEENDRRNVPHAPKEEYGQVAGKAVAKVSGSGVGEEFKDFRKTRERQDGDQSNMPSSPVVSVDLLEQSMEAGPLAQPQLRTDFRSTVIWQPTVQTNAEGKAKVEVKFPDSLTTWRATARAVTASTAIGNITHEVKSKKDLMVRLQAPRFFTQRDTVIISANVNNYSDHELKVKVTLTPKGINIISPDNSIPPMTEASVWVTVPSGAEKRVDWPVKAIASGLAQITVSAQAEKIADAMTRSYPVIPHGIEKFIAKSLVLKNNTSSEQTKELTLNIPKERIKESTSLRINLSPSLAANLMDALPYLANYPYGCVEQTMSRFLPAVIVAQTMRELGISKEEVESYISDVFEPRGDPQGHPNRRNDPSYSKLNDMTKGGLKRLYDFQHTDGGWGWWKDGDSDRFMSAYVLWGLGLARDAGIDVKGDVVSRATDYLQKQLVEEENQPDMLAWMLHALAQVRSSSTFEDKQRERLWQMRDRLNPYTRALFALSEHMRGNPDRAKTLAQNLMNGIKEDKENATAHWAEEGIYYRWSEGGVEATAFVIKALSVIEPQSPYLEAAVKWLTLNRRGSNWDNTKGTAIAILGLVDYLKTTKELIPDYDFQVLVNGKVVREGQVDHSNVFSFNRMIDVPAEALKDGDNIVKVMIKGQGALYASAYLKYFTLEEGITKAGHEIFVERKYYKQSTKETLMKGYTNEWVVLKDNDEIKSGDRIRVDLLVEAKNHYEYLIFEDYKPAGLEAIELKSGSGEAIALDRSGQETNERVHLYQEFRDQKAAFFISQLKQGKYLLRYELRAEIPGEFHAMPNQAHAMYVPEIRANSDEMRLKVSE